MAEGDGSAHRVARDDDNDDDIDEADFSCATASINPLSQPAAQASSSDISEQQKETVDRNLSFVLVPSDNEQIAEVEFYPLCCKTGLKLTKTNKTK